MCQFENVVIARSEDKEYMELQVTKLQRDKETSYEVTSTAMRV
jgi:hypothetical protein